MKSQNLTLKCQCGNVQGVLRDVSPSNTLRAVCYCKFCQSYQHHLGKTDDVLDELGGTDVFQMSPRYVEITQGQEFIRCLKLTDKGPLRFYASCCNTPLVNTVQNMKVPFTAINNYCVEELKSPLSRETILGSIHFRANVKPEHKHQLTHHGRSFLIKMVVRMVKLMMFWWLRGDAKGSPFRNELGQPIVEPVRVRLKKNSH